MISIKLCNITKSYGERTVLECINAEVREGSSLVITGKNGSGKSTLLRIMAGLTRPTTGRVSVEVDGKELDSAARRNSIGLVAPALMLYPELTARENLEFFARARGIQRSRKEILGVLARVGLMEREEEPLSGFSSGMLQRAKYAFALLHEPGILLLDEPTANLDVEGIMMVDEVIDSQKRRGIVILATNESEETEYGDEILDLGL